MINDSQKEIICSKDLPVKTIPPGVFGCVGQITQVILRWEH